LVAVCGLPCGVVCIGAVGTCFSGDTEFNTTTGAKLISELNVGDKVLTRVGAETAYTEVVNLQHLREVSPMLTFNSDYPSLSLSTTRAHLHFVEVYGKYGAIVPKHAASVEVGMKMRRADGNAFTITSKTKSIQPGRWVLMTDTCSAYANGILTTTYCSDPKKAAALSLLRVKDLNYVDTDGDGKIDLSEMQARIHSSFALSNDVSAHEGVSNLPEFKRVHVDIDKDGVIDRGELDLDFDADGLSDFAGADKDGDSVIDLTPGGKDGFRRNFTEEMFAEILKADGMPFGMQPSTISEQKLLFAWLKDSYDTAVAQCDADNNGKITRAEHSRCSGPADYRSQPTERPQQLAAAALQEAHYERLAKHVMGLFDTNGNDVLDGREIGGEMDRAAKHSPQMVPVQASKLAVGQSLPRAASAANPKIQAIQEVVSLGKWGLSTGSCTVSANGIITGTLCGNTSSPLWTLMESHSFGASDDNADGCVTEAKLFSKGELNASQKDAFAALDVDKDGDWDLGDVVSCSV